MLVHDREPHDRVRSVVAALRIAALLPVTILLPIAGLLTVAVIRSVAALLVTVLLPIAVLLPIVALLCKVILQRIDYEDGWKLTTLWILAIQGDFFAVGHLDSRLSLS